MITIDFLPYRLVRLATILTRLFDGYHQCTDGNLNLVVLVLQPLEVFGGAGAELFGSCRVEPRLTHHALRFHVGTEHGTELHGL